MTSHRIRRTMGLLIGLSLGMFRFDVAAGQDPAVLEAIAPPGDNYDRAEFRLWYPPGNKPLRAVVVLVPGSNDDGRSMVEDSAWRDFARRHHVALMGCRFTDKPHEQDFIEEYADTARGSGQALLNALASFATQSGHPELTDVGLLLWGISAGGEFNYEFAGWKPDRIIAFVVNKGGIYYTALVPRTAREVPGLFFIGAKDLAFRTNTIVGLFAVNRRAGALWTLVEEPETGHVVGRSRDMTLVFFDDVLALRVSGAARGERSSGALKAIEPKSGLLGDLKTKTFQAIGSTDAPAYPTAWLPTLRVARAWQALVTGKPFDP